MTTPRLKEFREGQLVLGGHDHLEYDVQLGVEV